MGFLLGPIPSATMKLLLLTALVAAVYAVEYTITTTTADGEAHFQTHGKIYAAAINHKGLLLDFGVLDNPGQKDFQKKKTDTFVLKSNVDLGELSCLILRAGSNDAWMVESVSIISSTDAKGVKGKNEDKVWLSTDTSLKGDKGRVAMMWCKPGV